jgi:hypothetical protein
MMMKISLLISASLLAVSSLGLVSALLKSHPETSVSIEENDVQPPIPDTLTTSDNEAVPAPSYSKDFGRFLRMFGRKVAMFRMTQEQALAFLFSHETVLKYDRITFQEEPLDEPPILLDENDQLVADTSALISKKETPKPVLKDTLFIHQKEEQRSDLIRRVTQGSSVVYYSRFPKYYTPITYLETDSHFVFLYAEVLGYRAQTREYKVAVFDKLGNWLANEPIAFFDQDSFAAFSLNKSMIVKVQPFTINWKSDRYENYTQSEIESLTVGRAETIDLKKRLANK